MSDVQEIETQLKQVQQEMLILQQQLKDEQMVILKSNAKLANYKDHIGSTIAKHFRELDVEQLEEYMEKLEVEMYSFMESVIDMKNSIKHRGGI